MKKLTLPIVLTIVILVALLSQCRTDDNPPVTPPPQVGTPYNFQVPKGFPQPNLPSDNPMTLEGIDLGHHLFYDKRLSGDLTMSCASCHNQAFFFSDFPDRALSKGIDGMEGRRNAMPIFNLAWQESFFWDGRAKSLEEQSLHPIKDPLELHADLETVISRLNTDSVYPDMFKAAFGDNTITEDRIAKALAQFERTIISADSEFDKVKRKSGNIDAPFPPNPDPNKGDANRGYQMFHNEIADCFHCHGVKETGYLMGAFGSTNQFKNNGLKEDNNADQGRMEVTGNPADAGKFKIPSVRNVEWSLPYMHDGSIATLQELIEFYNSGVHANNPTLDPNMNKNGGVKKNWTQQQKDDLAAFLETLTDHTLRNDTAFADPFEK